MNSVMKAGSAESEFSGSDSDDSKLREEFVRRTQVPVRSNVSGARATTMAVGGALSFLVEPNSIDEVTRCVEAAAAFGVPMRFLGAGSNLLLPDAGVREWVLRPGRGLREYVSLGQGRFEISAAMPLMTLSRELSETGFSGLEFAGGIPASFGGAVKMNAGAHGGEVAALLEEVLVVLADGRRERYKPVDLNFSYRHSELPDGAVVVSAVIRLVPSEREKTIRLRSQCLEERKARQPLTLPSSGSVFKNPEAEHAAGWYIERADLRGKWIGGAQISEMHANWILNPERKATAADVLKLIELCQKEVRERYQISLEPEIVRW